MKGVFSLFHCAPAEGGRGNLIFGKAAYLSLQDSRKGGVTISSFKRKKEIASSLSLAMTTIRTVIARALLRRARGNLASLRISETKNKNF
jgi:hypothetical protein